MVSAAIHGPGQSADIDVAFGTEANFESVIADLAEKDGNFNASDRAGIINKAIGRFGVCTPIRAS